MEQCLGSNLNPGDFFLIGKMLSVFQVDPDGENATVVCDRSGGKQRKNFPLDKKTEVILLTPVEAAVRCLPELPWKLQTKIATPVGTFAPIRIDINSVTWRWLSPDANDDDIIESIGTSIIGPASLATCLRSVGDTYTQFGESCKELIACLKETYYDHFS